MYNIINVRNCYKLRTKNGIAQNRVIPFLVLTYYTYVIC